MLLAMGGKCYHRLANFQMPLSQMPLSRFLACYLPSARMITVCGRESGFKSATRIFTQDVAFTLE